VLRADLIDQAVEKRVEQALLLRQVHVRFEGADACHWQSQVQQWHFVADGARAAQTRRGGRQADKKSVKESQSSQV
jgi:hypothetical protein